ncbi:MAG: hypothetical protein CMJ48_06770 [Planctomycetaceae bacterium]|nr:hypothetical protein [Planctomycetaceae bacterium]
MSVMIPKSNLMNGHYRTLVLCLVAVVMVSGAAPRASADDAAAPSSKANSSRHEFEGFFKKHCLDCHGGDEPEADFALDALGHDPSASREVAKAWRNVSQKLILGEMPPEDEPRPEQDELDAAIERINSELQRAAKVLRSKGGNEIVLRRLNKRQFNYTIHDLFGLEGDFAASFPDDATEHGFDNIGSGLILSASQLQGYMAIIDVILKKAIVTGERPKTEKFAFKLVEPGTPRGAADPKSGRVQPYLTEYKGDDVIVSRSGIPEIYRRFRAPVEGRYRIRITAYAIRNAGERLRLEVHHGNTWTRSLVPTLDGQIEVVDETPRAFEFTGHLKKSQSFGLRPPDLINWLKPETIAAHDGPGIVVRNVEIEGPLIDTWPPRSHRIIFGDSVKDEYSDEEVADILRRFASSAFRRPAPESEVKAYFDLYQQARSDGDDCLTALKHSLKAVLCSPYFLYLYEEPGKLGDFALASRLSYFLWCSTPDDELLGLAARAQLSQPDVLKQQVARMVADPKIDRFVNDFVGQWLDVDKVGEMQADSRLYPEYDAYLERSMREETQRFFREVLVNDLGIENFINSDFAMLNDRLATHYGIPGVEGGRFRRVKLPPDSHRGGLLTQASILIVTSNGTTTSPVVRGVWVLENIVGTPAPPPPAIGTDFEPDIRGAGTVKKQMEMHREIPQCNVCHQKIDPYGLALENFDVAGGWREHYRKLKPGARPTARKGVIQYVDGPPVESFADAPNFGRFDGFESFRKLLMKNKHLVVRCVAQKMMTYALGRGLDFDDDEAIDTITKNLARHDQGLKALVEQIVLSDAFHTD